ncbi:MAG: phenylalanine 4-monooxygenase [Sphingobacteriaceae bacterium]|jgi:phenylalanine-4-hydroxylase
MKTYPLKKDLRQNYDNYTNEDQLVWKNLFERQMGLLETLSCKEFIDAIHDIGFNANKIPNFNEVNTILLSTTGWSLEVVEGIIEEKDFFELLAHKKFPATTWLRKLEQLDYLPEPDMFHDVFGHVPLLINHTFSNFYQKFGALGVKHKNNSKVIKMLGRLYWFSVEFGLIKTSDELKIYGAGILSSHGESKYAVSDKPIHLIFNTDKIVHNEFDNSVIQNTYYVINSFNQLFLSLNDMEALIQNDLIENRVRII